MGMCLSHWHWFNQVVPCVCFPFSLLRLITKDAFSSTMTHQYVFLSPRVNMIKRPIEPSLWNEIPQNYLHSNFNKSTYRIIMLILWLLMQGRSNLKCFVKNWLKDSIGDIWIIVFDFDYYKWFFICTFP